MGRERAAKAFKQAYKKAKADGYVIDQADAAEKFGLHRTYVAQMGTGARPISLENALKAGEIFRCNPLDIADDEVRVLLSELVNTNHSSSTDGITLPRLLVRAVESSTIALEQPSEDDSPVQFLSQWAIDASIDPAELIDVITPHEFPGINPNDHLIVHRQLDADLVNDCIYVFSLVGKNIIRRVFVEGTTITLIDGNNTPQITSKSKLQLDDCLTVGRVRWRLGPIL